MEVKQYTYKRYVENLPNGDVKDTVEFGDQLIVYINGVIQQASKEWEPKTNPWEKWFAWRPVRVNEKLTWMSTIYRREKMVYGDQRLLPPTYEYGTLFDVLKEDK